MTRYNMFRYPCQACKQAEAQHHLFTRKKLHALCEACFQKKKPRFLKTKAKKQP